MAEAFGVLRMLQNEGALEVLRTMETTRKSKVAFEIRAGFGKKRECRIHDSMLAQPNGRSGSLSLEASMLIRWEDWNNWSPSDVLPLGNLSHP